MDRRTFLKHCLASSVASAGAAYAGLQVVNTSIIARAGRKRPNIIYILADDLGYGDIGCYGQQKIETPNIDKLAAEGMRFTQHYAGNTVCAPSRCVLLTGLHTGHSYIRDNFELNGYQLPIPEDTLTVSKVLKSAGYVTGCIGKWGLGGPDSTGHPNKQGFDHFYGYLGQIQAHNYYPDYLWRNTNLVPLGGQAYSHDLMTDEALWFLEEYQEKPFFLYIPYTIPHTQFQVPDLAQYANKEGWSSDQKTQAAMISRMDRDIGRIVEKVQSLGLNDNTLIIFTSDNGPHGSGGTLAFFDANGPLRGLKRDLYDGGIREPMVARWPGMIKPGTLTDHFSAFWDFFPTCCDLIGIDIPPGLDGISFLPTLLGQSVRQLQHDYLYWEFKARDLQAVRMGKWKAVRKAVDTATPVMELFDLDSDIGESNNIAEDYPEIVEQLGQIMLDAHTFNPNFRILYGE